MDCGFLLNKPVGMTTYDLIRGLKKQGLKNKLGHAGTLDPFATGLVVILSGQATKVSQMLLDLPKTYEGCIQFGAFTDTADHTGKVISQAALPNLKADFQKAADDFVGKDYWQTPPAFSAVKKQGKPLYELARQGIYVAVEPKKRFIFSFEISDFSEESCRFVVQCSSGTYIRVLAEDFCKKIGTQGFLSQLNRVQIGPFSGGADLNHYENSRISLEQLVSFLPSLPIAPWERDALFQGKQEVLKKIVSQENAAEILEKKVICLLCENRLSSIVKCGQEGFFLYANFLTQSAP
jgi:tRNA pseudouridine(55) synthase